ncbi:MAG: hypothetical protein AMXMBFR36_09700 [Acidobacteriota bacterium]
MPSPEAPPLAAEERSALLDIAWRAVRAGLDVPWIEVDLAALPPRLGEPGASFVSLHREGRLRGCMGRLEATRPLAEDVAGNARAAAYFDPRFPALAAEEFAGLELEISVLTPAVPLEITSEAQLLAALRPGVDGLILAERQRRATFLPTVWRELPDPRDFLGHLKRKAGLPADYWSESLRFERYSTESIA